MKSQKIKIYVFTLGKVKILVCAFFYSLHLKNKSKIHLLSFLSNILSMNEIFN